MPTTKQRITITATGDIEEILAVEARLHPDLAPSELVAMLIRRGHLADDSVGHGRADLVRALAGGVEYPVGYLQTLRDEWPD